MLARLRHTTGVALRSPAAQTFIGLYLLAVVGLLLSGPRYASVAIAQIGLTVWELVYLALTVLVTPHPPPAQPVRGRMLTAQLVFLAALVLFTVLYSQFFHYSQIFHAMDQDGQGPQIPLLSTLAAWLVRVSPLFANPLLYFAVPLAVLAGLFAVHPGGLGLRMGAGSLAVALIWSAVNSIFVIVQLALGGFSWLWVARRLAGNLLQNGFTEEFLWRGVIQTRLGIWLNPAWGAVLSALLFGLWHLSANVAMFQGEWLPALSFCIVAQARFGLFMSIVFLRTGSLIAPAIAHTVANLNPLNFL